MTWKTSETVTFKHDETIKFTCINCKCETNHKVLVSADVKSISQEMNVWDEHINSFHEWARYQVVQCLGCSLITFREEFNNENNHPNPPAVNLYPNPEQRYSIEGIDLIPTDHIKKIYKETLIAINNDQQILAGVGIRTILDAVTQEKKINGSSLAEKIDNLARQEIITKKDADILHKIRRIGNNSVHAIEVYAPEEIHVAMNIIEHLFQRIYILPDQINKNLSFHVK